jgi:VIT1/CCC1 family predicted Fe2+/Mn2+ transporter
VEIEEQDLKRLLVFQRDEITEHHIYMRLSRRIKSAEDRNILEKIAQNERRHCHELQEITGQDVKPDRFKIWLYYIISRFFGYTFGIKLMEKGEESAQAGYGEMADRFPVLGSIMREEEEHEAALIAILDEELLQYLGSIVLGLNDALVELTGALAGLTLALQDARLIALTGSITGVAAALSMGDSEYLSTKSEDAQRSPLKASVYTGIAYIITVLILILPYLLLGNYYIALGMTLLLALLVICMFTYYISVAREQPFGRRFLEMALISLGVAALSFIIGFAIRAVLGVGV